MINFKKFLETTVNPNCSRLIASSKKRAANLIKAKKIEAALMQRDCEFLKARRMVQVNVIV